MFRTCPRAFFYNYFPWGEPDQDVLVFLKRTLSLEQMIGQVVHDAIALALRQYQSNKIIYPDLAPLVIQDLKGRIQTSFYLSKFVKDGKRPPSNEPVLQHHLENGPSPAMEKAARDTAIENVQAFLNSEAWKFLQTTDTEKWEPIDTSTCTKPSILASRAIGFKSAFDLRVFTPFDLAIRYNGDFIIVDWKTGKRTQRNLEKARKQTVGYALWALDFGIPLNGIQVQPFWLTEGEIWDPQRITRDEVRSVQEDIEMQNAAEKALLKEAADKNGEKTYVALAGNFPAKPGWACAGCKFKAICPDRLDKNKPVQETEIVSV